MECPECGHTFLLPASLASSGYKDNEKEITDDLIKQTHKWLGSDGLNFFIKTREKYGQVNAVYMDGKLPHPVHFREGMSVRNFMRSQTYCKDWTDHDFDDNWVALINKVIEYDLQTDKITDGILYDSTLQVSNPTIGATLTLAVLEDNKLIRVHIPDVDIEVAELMNKVLRKSALKNSY